MLYLVLHHVVLHLLLPHGFLHGVVHDLAGVLVAVSGGHVVPVEAGAGVVVIVHAIVLLVHGPHNDPPYHIFHLPVVVVIVELGLRFIVVVVVVLLVVVVVEVV